MYCLTVLEAIGPGSRCPWGWFLLRVEREECVPCLPPIFWWLASNPGHSLACGSITSSLPASSHVLPGCVSVSKFPLFYRDCSLLDSVQFSSVAQPCPTLCDPMDCSRPGLPVQHQLTGLGTPILRYGLPWWLRGKESTCQCRRRGFDLWVGKIPWRRKWQLTPLFLPGKCHGQRSLAGCSPRDHEDSDMS